MIWLLFFIDLEWHLQAKSKGGPNDFSGLWNSCLLNPY